MRTRSKSQRPALWRRVAAWWVIAWMGLGPSASWAAPEGEQVRHGRADFSREGSHTQIDTHTQRTVIDYTSFDIGVQESVRIQQPNAQSRVLNRVFGSDATRVDGRLSSNGQVWIANPSGIFFGGRAIVEVASLVAAAGRVEDRDFMAGIERFTELRGDVRVETGARLAAIDSVLLAGRHVENFGHIAATDGMVALVAGDTVELVRLEGGVRVIADAGFASHPNRVAVTQAGEIEAAHVSLVAGDAYSLAMNHTGITRAAEIHVEGGDGGLVEVAGTLDASRREAGERGGSIRVLGEEVRVGDARLDASGDAGGGEIRVGGDFQGQGSMRTAQITFVSEDAELLADALEAGDGGTVIVWADGDTAYHGALSARGGARGGDGGFAEISGRRHLVLRGGVDLGATQGRSGTLLIDPRDIRIKAGAGADGEVDEVSTIFEDNLESMDASLILLADHSISLDDPVGSFSDGDLALLEGNSIRLETRNDDGDGEGSLEDAGIDLDSLNLVVSGAGVEIRVGQGDIRLGDVVARGGEGEQGGTVSIETGGGAISLASVDASGGAGGAGDLQSGGSGGQILLLAEPSATSAIQVTGSLVARGGDGTDVSPDGETAAAGGAGGSVFVNSGLGAAEGEMGSVTIGSIDVSGGDGAGNGGSASVLGSAVAVGIEAHSNIEIGSILATGGDGVVGGDGSETRTGLGGAGGAVSLRSVRGNVQITGDADLGGGEGYAPAVVIGTDADGNEVATFTGQGGRAGSLSASVEADDASITLAGAVLAIGGTARTANGDLGGGHGGAGGVLQLTAENGNIDLGAVDLRGGAGKGFADTAAFPELEADAHARGGDGGSLAVATLEGGTITLSGNTTSVGGKGGVSGTDAESAGGAGTLAFESAAGIDGDGHTLRGGTIGLTGTDITNVRLAASGVDGASDFEDRADIAASGAVSGLLLDEGGGATRFDVVEVVARGDGASFALTSSDGTTAIEGDGVDGPAEVHTVNALRSGPDDPRLSYRLNGEPSEVAEQVGVQILRVADGAVALGSSGGAIANEGVEGRLLGVVDGPGATLQTAGPLELRGTDVRDLSVAGSGQLRMRVAGEVSDVSVTGLEKLFLDQNSAASDASIDLTGDVTPEITIVGSVTGTGSDPIESSKVTLVDTSSGIEFLYRLLDDSASSNDPSSGDPALELSGIRLGGAGGFTSTGDLVILDTLEANGQQLVLVADSNGNAEGGISAIGGGTRDVDQAAQLVLVAGESAGSIDAPLRTGNPAGTTLSGLVGGELRLVNETGDLTLGTITATDFDGVEERFEGVSAGGAVSLENPGRAIVFEPFQSFIEDPDPDATPVYVSSVGDLELDGALMLGASPALVAAAGDVNFSAPIDAVPGASLDIVSTGTTTFGGDVGAGGVLDALSVDDAVFAGDRSVNATRAEFRGSLDGTGSLTLSGGPDSSLVFGGDIGTNSSLGDFSAQAEQIQFGAANQLVAANVLLNPAANTTPDDSPDLASIADTLGGLEILTPGVVRVGAGEELSVAGPLRIRAGGVVSVGDLAATSIDIEAPEIVVLTAVRDGDPGVDWVANDIRTSVAPRSDGAGPAPTLVLGDGKFRIPGGPPFRAIRFDAGFRQVEAASFDSGTAGRLLDLFGTGPLVVPDPSEDVPRLAAPAVVPLPPRSSGVLPNTPAPPGAEQVLRHVRCHGRGGLDCQLGESVSDSALATERAREIVERYHALVAGERGRRELARAFAPLGQEPLVDAPLLSLEAEPILEAARDRLGELAIVLAQVSLLGLDEADTEAVRREVARDFAAATGVPSLNAELTLAAAAATGVGVLP